MCRAQSILAGGFKIHGRKAFCSLAPGSWDVVFDEVFVNMVRAGGSWLVGRYGGNSAVQSKFIRWGNFLNIPCPGTGHDGDPNVSIYVTDEIREAVRKLLE